MFADVRQGGCPSYPAPGGGAPGPDGVQEGVPRQPAGPLPRRPDGAYFIDRNGASFHYVLEYLRGGLAAEVALSAATSSADMWQLVSEARYYGLDELAAECAKAAPPAPVSSFRTLVAACGVSGADILALTQEQLTTLLEQLGVNLVMAVRVRAAVERERERVRAEEAAEQARIAALAEEERARIAALAEEERAFETLRSGLRRMEAELSEAGLRTLVAMGFALPQACALDEVGARELGLSAEDARLLDALGPCGVPAAALTFGRLPAGVQGLGTNIAAGKTDGNDRCCVGAEVLDVGAGPVFWKAKLNAPGVHWLGLGVCTFAQLPVDGKNTGSNSAESWCWSSNGYNWPGGGQAQTGDQIWKHNPLPAEQDISFKLEHGKLTMRCGAQEQSMALPAENQQYRVLAVIATEQSSVTLSPAEPQEQF